MLDLSGRLAERGVQHGEGRREREGKKGEERDRKWRSDLSPREKFLLAPML